MKDESTILPIPFHFIESDFIQNIINLTENNKNEISVKSLHGFLRALTIAALWKKNNRNIFIVTHDIKEAEEYYYDLQLFLDTENLALLTEPERNLRFEANNLDDHLLWMIDGLSSIQNNDSTISIATPGIFDIEIPSNKEMADSRMTISQGETIDFENFNNNLALNGFEKREFVSSQGEFAVRGGIVDVFPYGQGNPLRIEFFGNEIESIREFEPISQRSILTHKQIEFIAKVFHSEYEHTKSTIFDYISDDTIFIVDSPDSILSDFNDFSLPAHFQKIYLNKLGEADININSSPQPQFHGSIQKLCTELRAIALTKNHIAITAEGKIHLERIRDLIENGFSISDDKIDLNSPSLAKPKDTLKAIEWYEHSLSAGFISEDLHLAYFTEHQIFDRLRIQSQQKRKQKGGITLQELKQLNIGDYVVHNDKGIGRFDGFETMIHGENTQDYLRLSYADEDVLYVNLNYLHKVQRYSSEENVSPKLSKLGSSEWTNKKAKAKKKLKDIARDLIKLYAERKSKEGYAFPADSIWQKELEASFIYEDTPDQAQSTAEVKIDMQNSSPMDRLICGDVGFGKTEIAIRAAFKSIQAGKQVAVLVPTTILAQQHFMTFSDRLQRYPVNVNVISRFRTKKEQTEILNDLKSGNVDILIGTHRLLSKDVEFKDLGLLIIDEEHRFGVGAKEKLRQMKVNIDTLTLTATPIPRTLNFSLMGARDLSVIETPPRNRLPIFTQIIEWNDEVIIKAIHQEIERKGQVFFVNDKIYDMEKLAMKLQQLMPTLKIGIAHGQMNSSELEKIMERFIENKYDVLLTTKIIESGLDIPNANTIIINNSNNFGLAELYQLRGRVGRTNIQAYCFLIIPPVKLLPLKSILKLQAIEEFSELGSGFQLALRDMEIRGAGNLLGPEQSGYINDIGFDLYQRILEEAVSELRIEEFSSVFTDTDKIIKSYLKNDDITIDIDSNAYFPQEYILNDTDRFYFYKRLYNVKDNLELASIIDEIEDRFGKMPHEARELVFAVKLRLYSINTGFNSINFKSDKLKIEFPVETNKEYYEQIFPGLTEYVQELSNARIFQEKKRLFLEIKVEKKDEALEILWRMKQTIKSITDNTQPVTENSV